MLKKAFLLALAAALLSPALASAAQKQGVVVKVTPAKRMVAVANARGAVLLVHVRATKGLRAGQVVRMQARKLRNGTYAGSSVKILRATKRVHIRGVVLKRRGGAIVLSARGAVVKVRLGKGVRSLSAMNEGPAPGSVVDATVEVSGNGILEAVELKELDPSAQAGAIEGHITAIGPGLLTVTDNGVSLQLGVPATIDLSKFKRGDDVLAYFSRDATGTLTLTAIGGDEDEAEADDESEIEGDVDAAEQEVEAEDEGGDDEGGGSESGGGSGG